MVPDLSALPAFVKGLPAAWAGQLAQVFFSPGSKFSLAALATALVIGGVFLVGRRSGKRPVPFKVLVRALFPRYLYRSASGRADIAFFVFNLLLASLLFGWAILSFQQVDGFVSAWLNQGFGRRAASSLPAPIPALITTVALYLAYELAYWLDHYLSHKIPVLWRFHRVHHTAATLSPLTNFRVHPVDSIVFYNLVAMITGLTHALVRFGLGGPVGAFAVGGTNILLLAAAFLLTHLQHSHLWISFSGPLGRVVLSPAHHQIHHSSDPRHFDRNFGSSLAVWDWLFGTLHLPSRRREKLSFGAEPTAYDPHSASGGLLMPFVEAYIGVKRSLARSAGPARPRRSTSTIIPAP